MRRTRRLLEVAVFAPLGAVATLAAARRRPAPEPALVHPRVEPIAVDDPAPRGAVATSEELPIDGYDHLAASQVVDRLGALTPSELQTVADYERAHRHRQSVLAKLAQLQG